MSLVSLSDIQSAQKRIGQQVHHTPVVSSAQLGEQYDLELYFKLELFQKTGSFKPRGVLNKLSHLSAEQKNAGVVSLSAGNHAQALAWGANKSGIKATIVMPAGSEPTKINATKGYGGQVVLTNDSLMDVCLEIKEKNGYTLVHPFDDLHVIAGQGTVGLEMLEDLPEIDTVIVSIGGGGLISGIAAAIKAVNSQIRIIGVEPSGSNVMTLSLDQNKPMSLAERNTIADGLNAPFAGKYTYAHVREFVDQIVNVSEASLKSSIPEIMNFIKVVPEAAAAATLAAIQENHIQFSKKEKVLCLICGGNISHQTLKSCL